MINPDGPASIPLTVTLFIQVVGAVAGGLVGGCSGFIANHVLVITNQRRTRRNIASALIGEIDAVSSQIAEHYLPLLCDDLDRASAGQPLHHRFRGERNYAPVFHSLAVTIGLLPSPLPRDLAAWYGDLAVCLERARELHDMQAGAGDATPYAMETARAQRESLKTLVRNAKPLIARLSAL